MPCIYRLFILCIHREMLVRTDLRYSSQFKKKHYAEFCSGSEEGSYVRLVDFCIT